MYFQYCKVVDGAAERKHIRRHLCGAIQVTVQVASMGDVSSWLNL